MAGALWTAIGQEFGISAREMQRIRNDRILQEFDGRNRDEICRRYGISKATFYRILSERPE